MSEKKYSMEDMFLMGVGSLVAGLILFLIMVVIAEASNKKTETYLVRCSGTLYSYEKISEVELLKSGFLKVKEGEGFILFPKENCRLYSDFNKIKKNNFESQFDNGID